MNTELFINTKYILSHAIACYRLSYLAIVHKLHMNYCVVHVCIMTLQIVRYAY